MLMRKVNASAEVAAIFYKQPTPSTSLLGVSDGVTEQQQKSSSSKHFVLFLDQLQMYRWERWVDKINNSNDNNDDDHDDANNSNNSNHAKLVMGTEGAETLKRKYIEYEKVILEDQLLRQQTQ